MKDEDLQKLRNEIDGIDAELIALLNRRYKAVEAIGEYKRERHLPVYDPSRQRKLMERLQKLQTLSIYSKFIHLRVDTDRSPYVHWLYVNCGEDRETMVEIFKSLAVDVYGIDFTREWDFTILQSDKKKVIQKKTEKIAKDNVKNHHLRVVRIQ